MDRWVLCIIMRRQDLRKGNIAQNVEDVARELFRTGFVRGYQRACGHKPIHSWEIPELQTLSKNVSKIYRKLSMYEGMGRFRGRKAGLKQKVEDEKTDAMMGEDCLNCRYMDNCVYCGREFCNRECDNVCHRQRCRMQHEEEHGYLYDFW